MNREKENAQVNSLFSRTVGTRGYGGYQSSAASNWAASNGTQGLAAGSMTMKGSASGQLVKESVSKFSSWANPSRLEEPAEKQMPIVDAVDELLMFEHEGSLSTPSDSKNSSGGSGGAKVLAAASKTVIPASKPAVSLFSPQASVEYDSFDLLEDEMLKGYAGQSKQEAHISPMKARPALNEDLAALDSYDLEGSLEDVNKII